MHQLAKKRNQISKAHRLDEANVLRAAVKRLAEPLIRTAVRSAMMLLAH